MRKSGAKFKRIDPRARFNLGESQRRSIGCVYHTNLQALMQGGGTEQAWATIAGAINAALLLCERGYQSDAIGIDTVKRAQLALLRVQERAAKHGKWVFDGEGLQDVLDAVNLYDQQIAVAKRSDITAALAEVRRRYETGDYFQQEAA